MTSRGKRGHTASQRLCLLLLVSATTLIGLSAGFFYAYEVSVRRGLALLDDAGYVAAMNGINATVQNAGFALGFFGALVVGVVALAVHLSQPRSRRTSLLGVAVALVVATVAITAAVSVPLNRSLSAGIAAGGDPTVLRRNYEADWNAANRLRTVTSAAALAVAAAALVVGDPSPRTGIPGTRRASHHAGQ